jgi:hypothetical protein
LSATYEDPYHLYPDMDEYAHTTFSEYDPQLRAFHNPNTNTYVPAPELYPIVDHQPEPNVSDSYYNERAKRISDAINELSKSLPSDLHPLTIYVAPHTNGHFYLSTSWNPFPVPELKPNFYEYFRKHWNTEPFQPPIDPRGIAKNGPDGGLDTTFRSGTGTDSSGDPGEDL